MEAAQHLVVSRVSGILEVFFSERSKVDSWIGWTAVSSRRSSGGGTPFRRMRVLL